MSAPAVKPYMNAQEIADLKLANAPKTKSAVIRLAKREGWRDSSLARKRKGKGGGWEFHVSLLNDAAVAEIARLDRRVMEEGKGREVAAAASRELVEAAPTLAMLNARQRRVMEARAAFLTEIDRRIVTLGPKGSRSRAVAGLLETLSKGEASEALEQAVRHASERGQVPSRSQIYAWLNARDRYGLPGLAPKAKRKHEPLPDWFWTFLRDHWGAPSNRTLTEALADYASTLPTPSMAPDYESVRRMMAKVGPLEKLQGRVGKLAMRKYLAYIERDTSDLLPSSIYIADGQSGDVEWPHPIHGHMFKPEITSILDVSTRVVVGWSIAIAENTIATAEALRMACVEWGIPAIFYTDRGGGYVSAAMTDPTIGLIGRIGSTHMKSLPRNAQAKAIVERYHQHNNRFARRFETYVGARMDDEARKIAFKTTRAQIKAIGRTRYAPTFAECVALYAEHVAAYNNTEHSALPKIWDGTRHRHMSPLEAWANKSKAAGFEAIVPSPDEAESLFRPHAIKKTARGLVKMFGNEYFAIELEAHYGEEVAVAYDIHDAGQVWVHRLDRTDEGRLPGPLIAVARFAGNRERYVPVTAERDAMEKRAKGRLRRLDAHRSEIIEELRPSRLLEQDATPTFPSTFTLNAAPDAPAQSPIIDAVPPTAAPVPMADNDVAPSAPRTTGRPVFHDDASLAAWLIAHPDEATPQDAALVRELLSRPTGKAKLLNRKIDLDALKAVVRRVA